MRALIYCRVSEDRAHGRSIREQEAESRNVCKREGWDVAEVITDTVGASRHSKGIRSGWERARQLLEAGDVDVLVTWEASRAQRDLKAYTQLRDLCTRTGTLWSYQGRTYDLDNSDDRFSSGLDALLAEKEADLISDRVQRAVRANAAAGRPHGRCPYGYVRTYDPDTGRLDKQSPDPDQAEVVRRIFDSYVGGVGIRTIRAQLNAEGIPSPTGGEWGYVQVRRIIDNPAYIARRVYRGEVIGDATWPPLVSVDLFERAHARRQEFYIVQPPPTAHMLTGVGRCGVCGGRVASSLKAAGRRVYRCKERQCVVRSSTVLDEYVGAAVVARLGDADLSGAADDEDHDAFDLRRQIAELEARQDAIAAEAAAGKITIRMLVRVERTITLDVARLKAELRRLRVPVEIEAPTGDVGDWWDALDPARRREYVNALIDVLVIHRTGQGRQTFDPSAVEIVWR